MDSTALLTLAFLDVLDIALEAFDSVWIPHSTMAWLFEERRRVAFHQPRRVREARQISDLLARDQLRRFVSTSIVDAGLASQIGDDLAALIAEAEANYETDDNTQHVVVRSSPVYLLSSLLEEEADLTAHSHVLTSCLAVVDKLQEKGQLTAAEEKRARSYLALHERVWPEQPRIADQAVVYLDELTISYLLHLGILQKLNACGLTSVVSASAVRQANELIAYDSISGRVADVLERVRHAVKEGIVSSKIKVGRGEITGDADEMGIFEHPTVAVLKLASDCDAIIVDDRYINQNESIRTETTRETPIYTTLDLLTTMQSAGLISTEALSEHVTLLRRAGYVFVALSDAELVNQLGAVPVQSGRVVENAELKAVRENILSIRMSNWLQLPKEDAWLQSTMRTLSQTLTTIWSIDTVSEDSRIRSDWLFEQMDIRGWTHLFEEEKRDSVATLEPVLYHFMMLAPPNGVGEEVRERYWHWLEMRVLKPMREREPELYKALLDLYRRRFAAFVDTAVSGQDSPQ